VCIFYVVTTIFEVFGHDEFENTLLLTA
jgi:hypothetical protein